MDEHEWIKTNNVVCALLRQAHDVLAASSLPMKRPWVGLTVEDRYKAIRPLYNSDENARLAVEHSNDEYEAIEAKLKEKNRG